MAFRTQRDLARLTLPAGKAEVFHFDALARGLSVRIQRTGRPAFVAWYSHAGKRKRVTLGAIDSMTLEAARRRAGEVVNGARDGRDAVTERQAAKRKAALGVYTLKALIDTYLADHAKDNLRPRTMVENRRALLVHWAPLHDLPVADVTRSDVSERVLQLASDSGRVAANRARATLSAAFAWGIRLGKVAGSNPVAGSVTGGDETPRDRVLSLDELRQLWGWAVGDGGRYAKIVQLLILLGVRREELASMSWSELDLKAGVWRLPASRTKTGHGRDIPLPPQAVSIFDTLPWSGDFVFAGRQGRPFAGFAWGKRRLDAQVPLASPWVLHDLRRSLATHLADHDIAAPHIIEEILGHTDGHKRGVAGIYNRAKYGPQQRRALERWADFLIENDSNFVQLVAAS